MQVKQTVTTKFHSAYTGWNSLEFTDDQGDEVSIKMTDEDYLSLADTLQTKANRIRKERADEAAEAARAIAEKNAEHFNKENEDG
ncbi:MAG: hypothetical protein ACYTDW_21930 [Planctomycetota bacterium]|jgi:hypothetical protein